MSVITSKVESRATAFTEVFGALAELTRTPGASVPLSDAIDRLAATIDTRLTRLDNEVSSLRRLLLNPSRLTPDVLEPTPNRGASVLCFGPFQLCLGGVPVDNWRSGRARALFQYLVNHRGQPIPRDTLIQALWPNANVTAPGTSLKVAVHLLRQLINQTEATDPESSQIAILYQNSCYQLNGMSLWIDVEQFESCALQGRSYEAQGRATEALALYARAADLYRGDFLEEISDDWPTFRREALKDQYLFALSRLASAAAATGEHHDAIVWCQRILAKDRCREDTYRMLMVCHAHLGQRSRVRSWFDLCVRTVRTELDCDPEPETVRTFRRSLAGNI